MTYTIPLVPQNTFFTNDTSRSGSGVANNGIRLDGPAPVDAILDALTLAPFDDCGGHTNLHVGYHYHAATDCLIDDTEVTHAAKIGIAMDGYGIFGHALADGTTPDDLDKCQGHEFGDLGYHYHAGEVRSNSILPCLKAEAGCASEQAGKICDASARPVRP